jgi:hypothetical protein
MEVSGAGSGIRQMQIVFRAGPDSGILRSGHWSDFATSCGKIAGGLVGGNGATTVAQLPRGHNVPLMERIKDLPARLWYPAKLKSSLPSIEEIEAELSTSKPPRRLREKLQ